MVTLQKPSKTGSCVGFPLQPPTFRGSTNTQRASHVFPPLPKNKQNTCLNEMCLSTDLFKQNRKTMCMGQKIQPRDPAGFGPCFHLLGFHLGDTLFLTHCPMAASRPLSRRAATSWMLRPTARKSLPGPQASRTRAACPFFGAPRGRRGARMAR